jgi:tetratricopeptide (TPR) repeat protein
MDDRVQKLWQRGLAYFNQDNLDAAQAAFESVLARDPEHGPARFRLSMIAMRRGNLVRAIALAREVRRRAPEQLEVNTHLARCLLQAGQVKEATLIATAAAPRALREGSATVLESLGTLFQMLGDSARALPLLDKANAHQPGQLSLLRARAKALQACGRLDDARTDLEACLALAPHNAVAHWQLADLRRWNEHDNHIARLQALLREPPTGSPDDDLLSYALFKELDDLDRCVEAWTALQRALEARRRRQRFDAAKGRDMFELVRRRFQPDFLAATTPAILGPTPIFLVGKPRAGIALMDRMLGRHSQIRSTGLETHFLQIYAQMCGQQSSREFDASLFDPPADFDFAELGRRFLAAHAPHPDGPTMFVETQPMNFLFLACIRRALPNAKILHMRRDPADACFSLLCRPERDAGPPVFDPLQLAEGHVVYQRLLEHWFRLMPDSIFDVSYESLVTKPEMVLRVMFAFLGLRYEAGVLAGVMLHPQRIGRWRRYAAPLAAMHARLLEADPGEESEP